MSNPQRLELERQLFQAMADVPIPTLAIPRIMALIDLERERAAKEAVSRMDNSERQLFQEGRKSLASELSAAISQIVWMARRYADGRRTYAPSVFNDAYDTLRGILGNFESLEDPDNAPDRLPNYPYATDGSIAFVTRKYSPPKPLSK